jgi:hypothetical protein
VVPASSVLRGAELFLNLASSHESRTATSIASFHAQLQARAAKVSLSVSSNSTLVGVGTSLALAHGVLLNADVHLIIFRFAGLKFGKFCSSLIEGFLSFLDEGIVIEILPGFFLSPVLVVKLPHFIGPTGSSLVLLLLFLMP